MKEDLKKYFEKNPMNIEKVENGFKFIDNEIDHNIILLYREQGYDAFQDEHNIWYLKENKTIKDYIANTTRKEIHYSYNKNSKLCISEIIHYNKFNNKVASFSCKEYELVSYNLDGTLHSRIITKPKLYEFLGEEPVEYKIINSYYYDDDGGIYCIATKKEDNKIKKLSQERMINRGGYIEVVMDKIVVDKPFPVNKSFIFKYEDYKKYAEGIDEYVKGKYDFYVLEKGEDLPHRVRLDVYKKRVHYANLIHDNGIREIFGTFDEYTDDFIYREKSKDEDIMQIITKDREEIIHMDKHIIYITYISDFENPYILDKEWR